MSVQLRSIIMQSIEAFTRFVEAAPTSGLHLALELVLNEEDAVFALSPTAEEFVDK